MAFPYSVQQVHRGSLPAGRASSCASQQVRRLRATYHPPLLAKRDDLLTTSSSRQSSRTLHSLHDPDMSLSLSKEIRVIEASLLARSVTLKKREEKGRKYLPAIFLSSAETVPQTTTGYCKPRSTNQARWNPIKRSRLIHLDEIRFSRDGSPSARCGSLSRHGRKVLAWHRAWTGGETAYQSDGKSANCSQGWASTSRGWRRVRWPSELDSGQGIPFWR